MENYRLIPWNFSIIPCAIPLKPPAREAGAVSPWARRKSALLPAWCAPRDPEVSWGKWRVHQQTDRDLILLRSQVMDDYECYHHNTHDGSVCMVYILSKLRYIDGKWQTIYGIHTDPSWDMIWTSNIEMIPISSPKIWWFHPQKGWCWNHETWRYLTQKR